MSNIETTVCIVGAGPAGLLTYDYLNNYNIPTIIFESSCSYGGQCTAFYRNKPIYGVPGLYNTNAGTFIQSIYNKLINKDNLILNATVDIIDINNNLFYLKYNDNIYICKYLILATGASSMKPVIPNIKGINEFINDKEFIQFYCNNFEQYKNKKVVIAGGGESAVDYAIELSKIVNNNTTQETTKTFDNANINHSMVSAKTVNNSNMNYSVELNKTDNNLPMDCAIASSEELIDYSIESNKTSDNLNMTSRITNKTTNNFVESLVKDNKSIYNSVQLSSTTDNVNVNCFTESSRIANNSNIEESNMHNNIIANNNSNVVLLHRKNNLKCDKSKLKLLHNIDLKLNQNIIEIRKNLIITDKEEIQANNIIFCYGFTYNNNLIKQLSNFGLELENNLVNVNLNSMETSLKSCYAVGDVVKYPMKKKNIISCCFEAERVVRAILNKEDIYNS